LENLNFLPENLERKYISKKINIYKIAVLILWIVCLILFMVYSFYNNKSRTLKSADTINGNKIEASPIISKNTLTINTLKTFLTNMKKDISFKTLTINNKRLEIESEIESRQKYYEIIDIIENKYKCNILYLTSPVDNNGTLQFKMLIEVQ
jgi:hypothetical protein